MYKFGQSKSRYTMLIVTLLLIFTGCTATWQPVCRHNALYQALTVGRYYPVRIALGPSNLNDGRWHAQAQALIDGKWRWLTQSSAKVCVASKDPGLTLEKYVSLEEAIKWIDITDKYDYKTLAGNQPEQLNPRSASILDDNNFD